MSDIIYQCPIHRVTIIGKKAISFPDRVTMWRSNKHLQESWALTCKTTLESNAEHSFTLSSSHANNLPRHSHPPPPTSQPALHISSTVHSLLTAKSKRQGNLQRKGVSPTQLSCQNNVFLPSLSILRMLSSNHLPTPSPNPSRILQTDRHHKGILIIIFQLSQMNLNHNIKMLNFCHLTHK